MKPNRIVLASVIAPIAAPVVMLAYIVIVSRDLSALSNSGMPFAAGIALVFGYLGLLLTGPVAIYLLRRVDMLNRLTLFAAGLLSGILVFWIFGMLFALSLGSTAGELDLLAVVSGAVLGGSVALVFGVIAGKDALVGNKS